MEPQIYAVPWTERERDCKIVEIRVLIPNAAEEEAKDEGTLSSLYPLIAAKIPLQCQLSLRYGESVLVM